MWPQALIKLDYFSILFNDVPHCNFRNIKLKIPLQSSRINLTI